MQELLNLLKEGKIEEALKGFKEIYAKTNNIIALYYITLIESHMPSTDTTELENNFKYLYNYSKKIRLSIIPFYIPFLLDIEDYKTCLKVSKQSLKLKLESYLLYYAYAKSLFYLNVNKRNNDKELDKAIDYLYKSLEFPGIDVSDKKMIYAFLANILATRKNFSKAYDLINGLYITLSEPNFVDALKLEIAIMEKNTDLINQMYKDISVTHNNVDLFLVIAEYYFENDYFDEGIECCDKVKPFVKDTSDIYKNYALAYFYKKDFDKAIDILNNENLNDEYFSNYLLGDCYYYKSGKPNLLTAIKYYEKAIDAKPSEESKLLHCIADCYCEMERPFELMNVVSRLKKTNAQAYIPFYMACYYKLTQHFDEAESLVKLLRKNKISESKISGIILDCAKNPTRVYPYVNAVFYGDDAFSLKECLKYKMNGEYGNIVDMKEASKYAKMLESNTNLSTCAYSTLSSYYLIIKDYEKSFFFAMEGYNKYLNDPNSCQCCAAYVAYHKLCGIGCKKDVKEAYKICVDTEKRELGSINENLGHVYAYCCIELGLELNHIYELLVKTTYRRYSASRYNMLIKVGKLLNKDTYTYEKMLKESLKYCSVREKSYLVNNDFFMNNY